MARLRFTVAVPVLLAACLLAAGCVTSGDPAPQNLPQDKLAQVVGWYNYNGTAWIRIDPPGGHAVGDTFTVTARTDLMAGETVLVRSWPVSFARADRYTISNGSSQNVTVLHGPGGVNTVSAAISAAGFREATYILSMENGAGDTSAAVWYNVTARQA